MIVRKLLAEWSPKGGAGRGPEGQRGWGLRKRVLVLHWRSRLFREAPGDRSNNERIAQVLCLCHRQSVRDPSHTGRHTEVS